MINSNCGNCNWYNLIRGHCNKHHEPIAKRTLCTGWQELTGLTTIKDSIVASMEEQCEVMKNTLISKNKDYGNSFEKTLDKYGDAALMLRLEDKFNRLESLFKNKENSVKDESFEDTARDLAGYCLLYLAVKNK